MKTAISLPDATFERVTRRARELGMSRSELFAVAAERYLDQLDRVSVVARIDDAVELAGPDEASQAAVRAGHVTLARDDW